MTLQSVKRLDTVGRLLHRHPVAFQVACHDLPHGRLIVDHHDTARHIAVRAVYRLRGPGAMLHRVSLRRGHGDTVVTDLHAEGRSMNSGDDTPW